MCHDVLEPESRLGRNGTEPQVPLMQNTEDQYPGLAGKGVLRVEQGAARGGGGVKGKCWLWENNHKERNEKSENQHSR